MKLFLWKYRIQIIFALFLLLRLIFLFRYPPFNDESIYVRYGQLMVASPDFRWASIQYFAKQPLAFWIFGWGAAAFGGPFTGARLAALLINSVSFYFFLDWLRRTVKEEITVVTLILFAVCPIFILFQSLALMEGFLLAAFIVLLWALKRYAQTKSLRYVAAMAVALAFGLWVKSNVIVLVIITIGILAYTSRKRPTRALLEVGGLLLGTLILLSPLFTRPDARLMFADPEQYTYSLKELLRFPIVAWVNNGAQTFLGLFLYLGPIYFIALFISGRHMPRPQFMPLAWWSAALFGASVLLGKIFTIRYAVLGVIPLLPLIAEGLLISPKRRMLALIAGIGAPFIFSVLLIMHAPWFFALFPTGTVLAGERNYGYYYTSGYAVSDAIRYVRKNLVNGPTILAVADTPGNPTDTVMATFYNNPTVVATIVNSPEDLAHYAPIIRKYQGYLMARKDTLLPFFLPYISEVKKFPTPEGSDFVGIYKINL